VLAVVWVDSIAATDSITVALEIAEAGPVELAVCTMPDLKFRESFCETVWKIAQDLSSAHL
jgi:hypothetical protein